MANDLRDLDGLIGLPPVSNVPPPLLGGAGAAPRRSTATRAARPTAAVRPGVTRPSAVRPPRMATRVASSTRPLLSAVNASTGSMGAEPLNLVVTLLAWIMVVLAIGNAWLLFRTGGAITGLPFSDVVHYTPIVYDVTTWWGHVGWPEWLSVLGAAALLVAATRTRGLREVGGSSGHLLFGGMCATLLGISGSLVGLFIVSLATGIGIAVCVVIAAVVIFAFFAILVGILSG